MGTRVTEVTATYREHPDEQPTQIIEKLVAQGWEVVATGATNVKLAHPHLSGAYRVVSALGVDPDA